VVGSQIASLTPGPSFAHNLGDRCPNGQCEAIFDIYASRPFQRHQEHLNAIVLGLAVEPQTFGSPRGLQILTFSKCWASPPHLAKVGLATIIIKSHLLFFSSNKCEALLCFSLTLTNYAKMPSQNHFDEPN